MRYDTPSVPIASDSFTLGRNVFLLGQTTNGPIHMPVPIQSYEQAARLFGEGNLLEAYRQVEEMSSNISVYLMRVSGEYARLSLLGEIDGDMQPLLKCRSVYGGSIYNQIHIYVRAIPYQGELKEALVIESPIEHIPTMSYVLENYHNLQQLVHDINQDTRIQKCAVYVSTDYPHLSPAQLVEFNQNPTPMQQGDDGTHLSKDELFLSLETAYGVLEGRDVDIICPYPARFDDTHPGFYYGHSSSYGQATYAKGDYLSLIDTEQQNQHVTFHGQLIDFCKSQERYGIMTHGVLGLREVKDPSSMRSFYLSRVLDATAFNDRYGLGEYQMGQWIDRGQYLSLVAQDFHFYPNEGNGFTANGCALYAAILGELQPNQTTTNRPLPDYVDIAFELSPDEAKDLSYLGAITARRSVKYGLVIANGVTASLPDSDLHSIANVRMVQYVLLAFNQVMDAYIGEPYIKGVTLLSLNKQLEETRSHLVDLQYLKNGSHYQLSYDEASQRVIVDLRLLTRYSVEFINAKASMMFANGGV